MLLDYASSEGEIPVINDAGSFYLIEHEATDVSAQRLLENTGWYSLFEESPDDRTWSRIFLTDKQNWSKKVKKVKDILSKDAEKIINDFQDPTNLPVISSDRGETLSGPLDPSAFKGLRGRTRGDYSEGQTKVDSHNWALACLGGAISGRYKIQKSQGNKWDYFVIFPVPQRIELNNFREIRNSIYTIGLKYFSIQNAAAHFSVVLAEKMRAMAASKSQFSDRFSGVFYFSIVQSGQQFKPATGGNLSIYPLMELALSGRPNISKVFEVWNYLFRKGSVQGCEDLAEAITEFIMNPSLETYEKHVKIFLKYISRPKEIKSANLYDYETLKEVVAYVR
ncbi:MAG: hypothetical protein ABIN61_08655 [candidate division WOR-3 bacterium]